MNYLVIGLRSIFFYLVIMFVYKIMGKREIGELSIIDFIVSIYIAELVAISIENYKDSILISLIPIILLVILQILTARVSLKSKKIRDLIDGKPSVIIENGKLNIKEMKTLRYNLDDLLIQLRQESIKSIEDIEYAILESNGKLSIFKKEEDISYPFPVILDGKIDEKVLIKNNKTKDDIEKELINRNILIENVLYAYFNKKELFIIEK